MKLLVGNGQKVTFRDVGEPVYEMDAKAGQMIPLHGFEIMTDEEARAFIIKWKEITNNRALNDSNN